MMAYRLDEENQKTADEMYMKRALQLAERALGSVAPNPAVGCVIMKQNMIIGEGATAPGGRPHAETVAMNNPKLQLEGTTMYVTLEPCCHHGVTGPCTESIIKARIKKVFVACVDPDSRVSGRGIEALKEAGIDVEEGLMQEEALKINIGFFTKIKLNRPFITVKMASTLDGKIASSTGNSKWITGEDTREWVHELRATNDAIMIGSNTLVADDPLLTCAIPGLEHRSPIRIIVDSQGKLLEKHKISKTADKFKTWIVTTKDPDESLKIRNVNYMIVSSNSAGKVCVKELMTKLATTLGLTRVLVEGGSGLVTELLKECLIDRLILCRSGKVLGNDSIPCFGNLGIKFIAESYRFKKYELKEFSEDVVEIWDCIRVE